MSVQLTLMIAIQMLPVLIQLGPLHVPAMLNTREMAQRVTVKNIVLQAGPIGLLGTRTGVRKKIQISLTSMSNPGYRNNVTSRSANILTPTRHKRVQMKISSLS